MSNHEHGGWAGAMGLEVVEASAEKVVFDVQIDERHHQPYGIVHGGVLAGLVETVCSVGAGLDARTRGLQAVGVENHTSFVRAVRSGRLRTTATPLQRGKRAQLWEANVVDEQGRLIATGRVRLLCIEPGSTGT